MKRSKFNLSYYKLLSCNMGSLVPVGLKEVLPGDTFQHATSLLLRCSPLLSPVMHPVHVRLHHWFVPHRIIWDNFENFITGGPDGMDATAMPTLNTAAIAAGSPLDYMGVPPGTYTNNFVSILALRGYQLIWNEWYRDQDLETPSALWRGDGADTITPNVLRNCAWEKDYFTSARPWEQKGPSITIPIGTTAPVVFSETGTTPQTVTLERSAGTASSALDIVQAGTISDPIVANANLTGASAVTINALREAFALQRFEEARARYGSRYTEYLRYLGVRSSDARLQRPEYLGGGKQVIQFSEVLQTAEGTDPVGDLKGHGIAAVRSNKYRRFFEEHGYIHTLLSVRPKTIYANGVPRTFNRRVKEDFFQRELQHIGQQEILNKEVYAASASPNNTFGYQDRYDEYRRIESSIAGEFRTTALDYWHMARIFASAPALNASFVSCVPTERTFAVNTNDVLWIMARHHVTARRMVAASGQSFIY